MTIQVLSRNIVLEAKDNFLINIYLNDQRYTSNNQTLLLTKKEIEEFLSKKKIFFYPLST